MHVLKFCSLLATAAVLMSQPSPGTNQAVDLHLMPIPASISVQPGRLVLDGSFRFSVGGYEDSRLRGAIARFLVRLSGKTGLSLSEAPVADPKEAVLDIRCDGAGEQIPSVQADESYVLDVTNRRAALTAPSPVGILRGLETLLQLVDLDSKSFFVPSLRIEDHPRFRWRGLLIDVSRHWEPADLIKRNLDAMAAVKMNVFHWHLSDDQGFRVESKVFPKLHKKGSEGKCYTQQEIKEVVEYARNRGIRVIPEFDMPGHTTAWLVAYPELASKPGPYKIERSWGVFDPCMDPTREKTYSFLNSFIGEMAGLFPDEYFHIGGDEVNGKHWNTNPRIRSYKKRHNLQNNRDLQAYFNQRLEKILAKHGKKMIGWDEILHPGLSSKVTIQSWRGQAALADSARQGHSGILSYGYYLDHMRPASFHYEIDPLGKEAASLTDAEKSMILGGEACMWAEFVNSDNIESRLWPRAAAIAERFWSPAEILDIPDLYRRLGYMDSELVSLGLQHQIQYVSRLRNMIGERHLDLLHEFAGLLKPTGLGTRQRSRKYSSLIPLNRLVDTVLPESQAARQLENQVQAALAGGMDASGAVQRIRQSLVRWQETANRLSPEFEQSEILAEVVPLTGIVSRLSERGIQALEFLQSAQKPSAEWLDETAALIKIADKPQAEMLVAIALPIQKLIEAANAMP
jgi:hexosaminidase